MDLTDRYLAAIARALPETQREDILAELRDLLLSQIEEKEERLGRGLDLAETEAVLKDFGHPLVVAFRYRRFQRLIGPEVFPFYLQALKACAILQVVIQLIVFATRLARGTGPWDAAGGLLDNLFFGLVWMVGAVTLAFTVVDHTPRAAATLRRWRPRRLPPAYVKRTRGIFEIVVDSVGDIVFIAWWTGAIAFANVLPGPEPLTASLAPVWDRFYALVLAAPLLSLAANLLAVLRPGSKITAGAELTAALYTALLAFVLLTVGPWVVVSGEALQPPAAAWRAAVLNTIVFWALAGVGIVYALEALWAVRRVLREPPRLGRPAKPA